MSTYPAMRSIAVVAVLAASACKGGSKLGGAGTGSASGSAAGSAAAVAPADARPAAPALLAEADVRALIDAWLAAQNTGNFAAYEQLYAGRFDGIKRVRARTWRFARAEWLVDRKRMFAHPMAVEARDIAVQTLPTVAIVDLTQAFTQGAFHDEGPKRIVVVVENGAARIAREEMLQSRVAAPVVDPDAAAALHLISRTSGNVYLASDGDPAWGGGPLTLVDGPDDVVVGQQAAKYAPAEVMAWRHTATTVYTPDGTACTAGIGDLYLQGGQTPHFGTRAMWRGDAGDDPLTDAEIAAYVFTAPYVMGELTIDGTCNGAVIAIANATPVFYPPAPDPVVDAAATKAFKRLDEYRSIQASWKDSGGSGSWAEPEVFVFGAPGGTRYVTAGASAGDDCGEFAGAMWAAWSVSPSGKLTRISDGTPGLWSPVAVLDSDGDGRIELIARGGYNGAFGVYEAYLEADDDGTLIPVVTIEYPYLDCSC
jgi:hypothetical protein